MKRRNIHRVHKPAPNERNPSFQWRFVLLTIICVGIVASGFIAAARQQFATMEFGLKNSKLRKQVEDLESERRRLILAKEVSLSPLELKQTAAKLGFREQMAAPPAAAEIKADKAGAQNGPVAELASVKVQNASAPTIQKTSDVKKLVKPIVQETKATTSPNERPRIAATEKQVASVSPKSLTKLR
jgi:hypothetical protein